ncbi:MAG: carbamoyltransferase C-terminal domain-containing protein, partial [Pseudonocardiaceae bacterium]
WDRVDRRAEQQRIALRRSFEQCCFPFEDGDGTEIMAYADFAASVQQALEAAMLNLARVAVEEAGSDNLVIGGGVGMNCSMIGALARSGAFADVYVPPFTYDAGVSLGAALMVAREQSGWAPLPRLDHAYLGHAPKDGDIEDELSGSGLVVRRLGPGEVATTTAQLLSDGAVVGWFQGRAEVGQRALGARSIVGDPRRRRHLARINTLKGREMWRPLAPSVLAEYADDLFTGGVPHATRFMLAACPVRPDVHPLMPATVHVDGTARPQLVSRDTNPAYWSMIDGFRQRTGVPAVVNTSFNLANEPIVYSPRDAVSTFIRSSLDALAIGDYLVTRSKPDGTGA